MAAGMPHSDILAQIQQLCREEIKAELDRLNATVSDLKSQMSLMGKSLGEEIDKLKRQLQMREQDNASSGNKLQNAVTWKQLTSSFSLQDLKYDSTEGYSPVGHGGSMEMLVVDQERTKHSSEEYENILKRATHFYDLDPDVWGAAQFVIMKDFADVASGIFGFETTYRMGMVLLFLILNVFLQFAVLSFTGKYVVLPGIADVQNLYKAFHNEAFIAGQFDQPSFDRMGDVRAKICTLALSRSLFLWICLFLWVARCANELRLIYRRALAVNQLPPLPAGVLPAHMAYEVREDAEEYISEPRIMVICLNRSTRVWLYSLIFVPRAVIACYLLVVGAAFLTATEDDAELILNSLAMSFVCDIDELLMRCFLPVRLATNIAKMHIVTPTEEDIVGLHGKELERAHVRKVYLRAFAFMVFTLLFLIIWWQMQFVIPGYEWDVGAACDSYLESLRKIPCSAMDRNCFPK